MIRAAVAVAAMCRMLNHLPVDGAGICDGKLFVLAADPSSARSFLKGISHGPLSSIDWNDDKIVIDEAQFFGLGSGLSFGSPQCTAITPARKLYPGNAIGTCSTDNVVLGAFVERNGKILLVSTDHGIEGQVGRSRELISNDGLPLQLGLMNPDPLDVSYGEVLRTYTGCPKLDCDYGPSITQTGIAVSGAQVSKCGKTAMKLGVISCPQLSCVKVDINGDGTYYKFNDVILIKKAFMECQFADDGDSGSMVFSVQDQSRCRLMDVGNPRGLGILFAKSLNNYYYLATPMTRIFRELGGNVQMIDRCMSN